MSNQVSNKSFVEGEVSDWNEQEYQRKQGDGSYKMAKFVLKGVESAGIKTDDYGPLHMNAIRRENDGFSGIGNGDRIRVWFRLRGNEYNRDGKVTNYTNVQVVKANLINKAATEQPANNDQPSGGWK